MPRIIVQMGMVKVAIPAETIPFMKRVGQWVKNYRPTWQGKVEPIMHQGMPGFQRKTQGVKRTLFGEIPEFYNELRQGTAFSPEMKLRGKGRELRSGLAYESLKAPGVLNKLLFYGWPAYDIYNTLKSPSGPGKAEQIGGLLASTPAWIAGWRPLGMVGSTIAASLAERVGRGAGHMVDQARQKLRAPKQPSPQYGYPQNYQEGVQQALPQQFPYGQIENSP